MSGHSVISGYGSLTQWLLLCTWSSGDCCLHSTPWFLIVYQDQGNKILFFKYLVWLNSGTWIPLCSTHMYYIWICRDIHDTIVFSPNMNRARWISYNLNKTKTSGRCWQRLKLGLSKSTRTYICLVIGQQTPWTALSWDSFITPPNNSCIFQYSWFIWGGLLYQSSCYLMLSTSILGGCPTSLQGLFLRAYEQAELQRHWAYALPMLTSLIDRHHWFGIPFCMVWICIIYEYALFNKESCLVYGRAEYS